MSANQVVPYLHTFKFVMNKFIKYPEVKKRVKKYLQQTSCCWILYCTTGLLILWNIILCLATEGQPTLES